VRPGSRTKSRPIFTQVATKGAKAFLYEEERFLKFNKKLPNIWANFVRDKVSKIFQK